jgi:hypothetical protein
MAKKARKKMEDDAVPAFEFPPFDDAGFLWKEYELATATAFAGVFALALGLMGWVLTGIGLNGFIPLGLGVLVMAGSVYLLQRIRPNAAHYTKGDWAGLLALEFFGWFAIWFLLLNLAPSGF